MEIVAVSVYIQVCIWVLPFCQTNWAKANLWYAGYVLLAARLIVVACNFYTKPTNNADF